MNDRPCKHCHRPMVCIIGDFWLCKHCEPSDGVPKPVEREITEPLQTAFNFTLDNSDDWDVTWNGTGWVATPRRRR